jgi:hypothetical protein
VKIIQTENLDVDLVAGGHVAMFVTEKEVETAQADYAAAKAAGVNLDGVEWLSKEVVESVSVPGYFITIFESISLDLWGFTSCIPISSTQSLAPEAGGRALQISSKENKLFFS